MLSAGVQGDESITSGMQGQSNTMDIPGALLAQNNVEQMKAIILMG